MRLVKLTEIAEIKSFDCGDQDLNEFLYEDARFYNEQFLAHTYVLGLWRKLRKNIPHEKHYDSYPAVKIGRFAVSLKYAGRNIGSDILDFIKRKLADNNEYSASRFLTVDAYRAALPFYEKNGFMPLLKEPPAELPTIPLYYDLFMSR